MLIYKNFDERLNSSDIFLNAKLGMKMLAYIK